mgnify:CR=1 FL=1
MSTLSFMDLKRQYKNIQQDMRDAFDEVCQNTAFAGGLYVAQFEKDFAAYIGVNNMAAVDNGTDALFMAVRALGIRPGDEVIVPANTFIATSWAPAYVGAKIVFVDCKADTWQIDPVAVEAAITEKTKAVIAVHLYGQPFDIDSVKTVTDAHGLYLIEDCAQAHGAKYKGKMVGGFGDIGCFSFYPGKNLGAYGDGGGVVSNNEEYIAHIKKMRDHGSDERYQHDELGFCLRMDGIQGAILSKKLKYLPEWTARRQEIARRYFSGIKNPFIRIQYQPEWAESVFHLFVALVDNREDFFMHMKSDEISCGIHYPIPCHLQKAFADLGYKKGDFPNAEYEAEHCVSLPMFPEMTDDEVKRVIVACNSYKA